ncbi:PP2C family protein-serine/threonine phosphatase [Gilvimarinus algae]|uniref:Protein phosphatase 2C domain-containing protein n=1 Tax=Gilvimarinus algae TaxID=3058037 RepID=A0ABT8TFH6_9GAMM|nr:protein phosphatase 2C domain-containing protein [Gilvimarinus sp. SDUM040014]MDO3382269.1 protein phosphatase 2C domain-containing protein [Gilvimarinus sp. SDUM040014]
MNKPAMQVLESSSLTNPGRKRSNNEDCFLSLPEHGLWMVADGMGGHEAGEVASAIVRETFDKSPGKALPGLIQEAHRAVLKAAEQGVGAQGMGSTVVAIRHRRDHYDVAWVGDSRAYAYSRGGELEQLTTDHSYVQMLLESGAIEPADAENHPDKNIITQCLGSQELDEVRVDTVTRPWHQGQWLLLCSDGLTDELSGRDIEHILRQCRTPAEATRELVAEALKAGGRDNVTVQVIAAPTQRRALLPALSHWVPVFTHSRRLDGVIYATALFALVALLYWIFR